jgi:murein L,D-transpeptidase YafK
MTRLVATFVVAAVLATGGLIWAQPHLTPLPADAKADLLVVDKAARRLSAYSKGMLLRAYPVSLGRVPIGAKAREGDRRTPEGRYFIDNHNPSSAYHKALHVSYPSPADVARARTRGYEPGGQIMVHGIRNGLGWIGRAHLLVDWTVGCVAVTDPEIEELYRIVPDGTPIELRP